MNLEEWKPDFGKMAEKVVRSAMAGHTEEEVEEAISNYEEYLSVVWDIVDRLEREGKEVPTTEELEEKMLAGDVDKRRKPKKKGLSDYVSFITTLFLRIKFYDALKPFLCFFHRNQNIPYHS